MGTKASSAQGRTCSEWPCWGYPGEKVAGPDVVLAGRKDSPKLQTLFQPPGLEGQTQPIHQPTAARDPPPSFLLNLILSRPGITSVIAGSRARRLQSPGPAQCRSPNWQLDSRFYNSTELSSRCRYRTSPFSFLSQLSPSSVILYPRAVSAPGQ